MMIEKATTVLQDMMDNYIPWTTTTVTTPNQQQQQQMFQQNIWHMSNKMKTMIGKITTTIKKATTVLHDMKDENKDYATTSGEVLQLCPPLSTETTFDW